MKHYLHIHQTMLGYCIYMYITGLTLYMYFLKSLNTFTTVNKYKDSTNIRIRSTVYDDFIKLPESAYWYWPSWRISAPRWLAPSAASPPPPPFYTAAVSCQSGALFSDTAQHHICKNNKHHYQCGILQYILLYMLVTKCQVHVHICPFKKEGSTSLVFCLQYIMKWTFMSNTSIQLNLLNI